MQQRDSQDLEKKRGGEGMENASAVMTRSSRNCARAILAPYANVISLLLLSRCMWPPLRMRALVARALAQCLNAAIVLQCSIRSKRSRARQKQLAASLIPALYRSQRCIAAVRLIQRTFISHRVRPLITEPKSCCF
jgi:hypothetical protein